MAVILRTGAQRMFRAGGRNILRTACGTVASAATPVETTRVLRVFVKNSSEVTIRSLDESKADIPRMASYPAISSILGIIGNACSFAGVCDLAGSSLTLTIDSGTLNVFVACLFAAIPLVWMYILVRWSSQQFGCESQVLIGFDGIPMRAYFTASASSLTLTADLPLLLIYLYC